MAKKKSKNSQQKQQKLSPERFMREKARKQTIGKCYISSDWRENGIAHVIVTRERANGNLVMGVFLVDIFCLGVKGAGFNYDMPIEDFEEYLGRLDKEGLDMTEISYVDAHNIIYGAIEFASEGGIEPDKEFNLARYVLEEDTDDIPLIDYEFGVDGKHKLYVSRDSWEARYIDTLKKNLGDDFEVVMPEDVALFDDDEDSGSADDSGSENIFGNLGKEHYREEYSYQHPDYPAELSVKHQFIVDELFSPENYTELPPDVIEHILALPKDEAVDDISNIIMYQIGRTYKGIEDESAELSDDTVMMHAALLLTEIGSERGLDAALEILRQSFYFIDYHFGDTVDEFLVPLVYACGRHNPTKVMELICQPGLDSFNRSYASDAMAMIAARHPERRQEIIGLFRSLLVSMADRLPRRECWDDLFAGLMIYGLLKIRPIELYDEIRKLYDIDCVDISICGNGKKVLKKISEERIENLKENFPLLSIHERYADLRKWLKKP